MTYRWNPGPENPRRGDAVSGDLAAEPDPPSPYGDPDGRGGHDATGNVDTWISRDTGTSAASASHWQPGYEPLGHSRPGRGRAGDVQRGATRQGDAWQRDARPGGAWTGGAWPGETSPGADPRGHAPYQPPGYAPAGYQEDGGPPAGQDPAAFGYRPPGERAGGVPQTLDYRSTAAPQTGPPVGNQGNSAAGYPAASVLASYYGQPTETGGAGYELDGHEQSAHQVPGPKLADHQMGGYASTAQVPAEEEPAGYGTTAFADSGHQPAGAATAGFRWADDEPPAYQAPGYQPPGAADVVSYGYPAEPADAVYHWQGEPAAGGASAPAHPDSAGEAGWLDQPNWARGPEAGQPEFVLHGPSGPEPGVRAGRSYRDGAPRRAHRGRRGRMWLGIGAVLVVVVAAVAVFYSKLGRQSQPAEPPAAPAHALATPQTIGAYSRDQQAEQVLDLRHNEQYVMQIEPGHVSGIVAAVYDTGGPASSPDHVAVIAGKLVNSSLADVVKSFTQQEAADGNAPMAVAAGPLGGKAACAGKGKSGICLWADGSTVGVVVSATISPSSLAQEMLTIRSGVEVPAA